jgi:D-alanyl-D-alanine dipeptidase
MNTFAIVLAVATLGAPLAATAQHQLTDGNRAPLANSQQALVVTTENWGALQGTLQRYERSELGSPWQRIGEGVPVVVGKKGLAWGSGLQQEPVHYPAKQEGDGRAPAGVFRLGPAFGESTSAMPALRLPYLALRANGGIECVDDVQSSHYNRLVSKHDIQADWKSSEKMWEEPLYKWGVVVQYNTPDSKPGAGSCIFLHVWRGEDTGTAGCTAMAENDLIAVMKWLDPAKNPVIVQLPYGEYVRLREQWRLP